MAEKKKKKSPNSLNGVCKGGAGVWLLEWKLLLATQLRLIPPTGLLGPWSRLFTQYLLTCVRMTHGFFSAAFDWSRVGIVHRFSVLLSCPFPAPLARKSSHLLELLLSVPIGVSRLLTSLTSILGYMRPKENPRDSPLCCSLTRSLLAALPSSLCLSLFLNLFHT